MRLCDNRGYGVIQFNPYSQLMLTEPRIDSLDLRVNSKIARKGSLLLCKAKHIDIPHGSTGKYRWLQMVQIGVPYREGRVHKFRPARIRSKERKSKSVFVDDSLPFAVSTYDMNTCSRAFGFNLAGMRGVESELMRVQWHGLRIVAFQVRSKIVEIRFGCCFCGSGANVYYGLDNRGIFVVHFFHSMTFRSEQ